jgi:hypothetical protein
MITWIRWIRWIIAMPAQALPLPLLQETNFSIGIPYFERLVSAYETGLFFKHKSEYFS